MTMFAIGHFEIRCSPGAAWLVWTIFGRKAVAPKSVFLQCEANSELETLQNPSVFQLNTSTFYEFEGSSVGRFLIEKWRLARYYFYNARRTPSSEVAKSIGVPAESVVRRNWAWNFDPRRGFTITG